MLSRPRLVVMGAIASLTLASAGCFGSNPLKGGVGEESVISNGHAGISLASATIKGTVLMPGAMLSTDGKKLAGYAVKDISSYKPVVGVTVQVMDERLKKVPNSGTSVTDANGHFRITSIAANAVCFLTAEISGVTMATAAVPLPKKDGEVDLYLNYSTTLAVAGLLPLFTETAEHSAFIRDDLSIPLFNALVAAIEKTQSDKPTIKLTKDLKATGNDFKTLMAANKPVKDAYDAIVGQFKTYLKLRADGHADQIPTPGSDQPKPTPTPAATATAKPNGGPTTAPTTAPTTGPTAPPPDFSPIQGAFARVGNMAFSTTGSSQIVVSAVPAGLLIADDSRLVVMDNTEAFKVLDVKDPTEQPVTKMHGLVLEGALLSTVAYTVGEVGGKPYLVKFSAQDLAALQNSAQATAHPTLVEITGLPFGTVGTITALARRDANTLIAANPINNALIQIPVPAGGAPTVSGTVYSGGATGAGSTVAGPVNGFVYERPNGLALDGAGGMFVSDTLDNRLVKITFGATIAGDTAAPYSGAAANASLTNGVIAAGLYNQPQGLFFTSDNKLLVADTYNQVLRQLKPTGDAVISYVTAGTAASGGARSISFPTSLAKLNNNVYALTSSGELWKFTPAP